jgi:tetratricopeptide (TPR) repeat protein
MARSGSRGRTGATRPAVSISSFNSTGTPSAEAATEMAYGRPSTLKVFISSVMRDGSLTAERQEAASVVDAHPDTEPWLWERNADAGPYSSLEVCKGHASTSDILLLIVASDISDVTEAEWHAAQRGGATCAMLMKAGVTRSPRLRAFIGVERSNGIDVTFDGLSALRQAVEDALRRCMTDAVRQRALRRRLGIPGAGNTTHLLEAGVERAEQQYFQGSASVAAEVLEELDMLLGPDSQRPEELELITGLVHGAAGRSVKAVAAYKRVIENPASTDQAVAIAHQNLSLEALRIGDLARSRELMRLALKLHQESGDWFGVLQMLLNRGTLAAVMDDLALAAKLADLAEELIGWFREPVPHQRSSLIGLRGQIAAGSGRYEDALVLYKRAYRISKRARDRDGETVGAQNVAAAYHDLGRPALARRWGLRALRIAEETGTTWRREEIHRLLAIIAVNRGDLTDARDNFESARVLAEAMNDMWRAATLEADIGAIRVELGDPDAKHDLDAAYETLSKLGDIDWMHRIDLNRVVLAEREGDREVALETLSRIADEGEADPLMLREARERMASIVLGEPTDAVEALQHFRSALQMSTDDAPEIALVAGSYAHRLQDAGCLDEALELFDLAQSSAGDNPAVEYDVRSDRALLLVELGDLEAALPILENCLEAATRLRDRERQIRALHNVGEIARRAGDLRRSTTALRKACTLAARTGDEEARRSAAASLAITQIAENKATAARATATSLLADSEAVGDDRNAAIALGVLGGAAFLEGDYLQAADWYRKAARRDKDDPVHRSEDLEGIAEAHAAAGRWRPTFRAVQNVVTHAQEHDLEAKAWPSLLRAARWYLDRSEIDRAATITMPAWVLASQTPHRRPSEPSSSDDPGLEDTEFYDAMLTTAFHELWSGLSPCDGLYDKVFDRFEVDDEVRERLWEAVAAVRAVVRDLEE